MIAIISGVLVLATAATVIALRLGRSAQTPADRARPAASNTVPAAALAGIGLVLFGVIAFYVLGQPERGGTTAMWLPVSGAVFVALIVAIFARRRG